MKLERAHVDLWQEPGLDTMVDSQPREACTLLAEVEAWHLDGCQCGDPRCNVMRPGCGLPCWRSRRRLDARAVHGPGVGADVGPGGPGRLPGLGALVTWWFMNHPVVRPPGPEEPEDHPDRAYRLVVELRDQDGDLEGHHECSGREAPVGLFKQDKFYVRDGDAAMRRLRDGERPFAYLAGHPR